MRTQGFVDLRAFPENQRFGAPGILAVGIKAQAHGFFTP